LLDPKSLKHFTFRECRDSIVVETGELVLALNKKLEKAHIALKDLEVGLTLDVPGEAVGEFEGILRKRLKWLTVPVTIELDDGSFVRILVGYGYPSNLPEGFSGATLIETMRNQEGSREVIT
jgi:hypothetical protein